MKEHSETAWKIASLYSNVLASETRDLAAQIDAAIADQRQALKTAIGHLDHMAAWITAQKAGYSFESLGEDMPGIRAAMGKVT